MLRLVKYDFRRNRDRILAIFVITILAQFGIGLANFADYEMFSLNPIAYVITVIIFMVFSVQTYAHNTKSYQRRLLPVKTLYTVLSPLLLFLALITVVLVMASIHLGVYIMMYSKSFLPVNFWSVAGIGILQIYWSVVFLMLTGMFSVTLVRSLRIRGRVWIGIATLYLLQNGLTYIEYLIFGTYFSALDNAFQFGIIKDSELPSGIVLTRDVFNLWPTLFEFAIMVILLYIITKLVKKRVEL